MPKLSSSHLAVLVTTFHYDSVQFPQCNWSWLKFLHAIILFQIMCSIVETFSIQFLLKIQQVPVYDIYPLEAKLLNNETDDWQYTAFLQASYTIDKLFYVSLLFECYQNSLNLFINKTDTKNKRKTNNNSIFSQWQDLDQHSHSHLKQQYCFSFESFAPSFHCSTCFWEKLGHFQELIGPIYQLDPQNPDCLIFLIHLMSSNRHHVQNRRVVHVNTNHIMCLYSACNELTCQLEKEL